MRKIDKSLNTALYLQLMDILVEKINNYMDEHEQVMSEREICSQYQVSRTTVRQALDELEKEGFIYKLHGKGTFVAPKKLKQDLVEFYSFTQEMKKIGKKPQSEVTGLEIVKANEKLKRFFGCKDDELLYKITRIRKADNNPMMYEVTYLPYNRFEGITKSKLESKALYEILVDEFKVNLTSAEEFFEAIVTKKIESIYLAIPEGAPSLKIERFTYDNSKLIEYTIGIARGDKFKYRVCLNNKYKSIL